MNKNSKLCRFCLYEEQTDSDNKLIDIYDTPVECHVDDLKNISIFINSEDNIPSLVCKNCLEFIEKILTFLRTIRKSEDILNKLYNTCENNSIEEDAGQPVKSMLHTFQNYIEQNIGKFKTETSHSTDSVNTLINKKSGEDEHIQPSTTKSWSGFNKKQCKNTKSNIVNKLNSSESSDDDHENLGITLSDAVYYPGGHKINIFKNSIEYKTQSYPCSICCQAFDNFFDYQDHQESHNGERVFCCSKCNETFPNRLDLVEHENKHRVSCVICGMQVLPKSLTAHMKKHTDLYKCSTCHSRHSSKAALETHFKARHAGIKGYICYICGKQISCQTSMKRHLSTHITTKPFKCKMCSFATKHKTVLNVHILRKHSNQTSHCDICDKPFKSELSLYQHKRRTHQPKRHVCKHCDKSFCEKFNLDQHMTKKHSKQRIYECKECHHEFFTVQKLKDHMLDHRTGCICCQKCGRKFFYRKRFDRHVQKCCPDLVTVDDYTKM